MKEVGFDFECFLIKFFVLHFLNLDLLMRMPIVIIFLTFYRHM